MKEIEKLRVLLPHWIEHNNGHEAECTKWAELARENGKTGIAEHIEAAVETMRRVNDHLEQALAEAGGKAEGHHHHHH